LHRKSPFKLMQSTTLINSITGKLLASTTFLILMAAPARAIATFSNGMINYLTDFNQHTYIPSDGKLRGLTDSEGHEILPVKFANIQYFGHGIFLATDPGPKHKYYFGKKRHFFNMNGVELGYKLPTNAVLLTVFSYGAASEKNRDLELENLPSDAVLVAGYNDGSQSLCDRYGRILIAPNSGKILFIGPTLAFLDKGSKSSIVDFKNGIATPSKQRYEPESFPPPRPTYEFPKNRLIKINNNDDGSFDSVYWKERRTYPIPILCMLNRFLRDHDLIGMSRSEVEKWLGSSETAVGKICGINSTSRSRLEDMIADSNSNIYRFPFEGCVPYFSGIRIVFTNNRVSHWNFVDESHDSSPISKNVILKTGFGEGNRRLLAARIGEHPDSDEDGFPLLENKPEKSSPQEKNHTNSANK